MTPFHALFALFLIVPLLEIWVLIRVGGAIGAGWTVFLVVFTAVLGAALVRAQGVTTFQRIRLTLGRGELPALEMLEGMALLVAGALLLTPGFFTDGIGFALLVPAVRRRLLRGFLRHGLWQTTVHRPPYGGGPAGHRAPLEGQWRDEDVR